MRRRASSADPAATNSPVSSEGSHVASIGARYRVPTRSVNWRLAPAASQVSTAGGTAPGRPPPLRSPVGDPPGDPVRVLSLLRLVVGGSRATSGAVVVEAGAADSKMGSARSVSTSAACAEAPRLFERPGGANHRSCGPQSPRLRKIHCEEARLWCLACNHPDRNPDRNPTEIQRSVL